MTFLKETDDSFTIEKLGEEQINKDGLLQVDDGDAVDDGNNHNDCEEGHNPAFDDEKSNLWMIGAR